MKPWLKWLIWFFLLNEMIGLFCQLCESLGMITVTSFSRSCGIDFIFEVLSVIAFTAYTMKIKDL